MMTINKLFIPCVDVNYESDAKGEEIDAAVSRFSWSKDLDYSCIFFPKYLSNMRQKKENKQQQKTL